MLDNIDREAQASAADGAEASLPVGFVPTPTREYNRASARGNAQRQSIRPALKLVRSADAELGEIEADAAEAAPAAAALLPVLFGSRALIYKQDPSVGEIGVRKVLLRGLLAAGPRNARIQLQGVASVAPNTMNDFIQTPDTEAFDAVHCFAVVHQALTMCQRAMGATIRWQWNSAVNVDPIKVLPRAGETMNAFYSRTEKALKFFFFRKPGAPATAPRVFTCRSFDIVSHEAGHAVLDSLKPGWIGGSANPQTGALHEAFGDILAIFLALSQLDQVESLIVQTKGDLHNKTFLSDVAEEFGLALGRDNGLRNADNDKRMSDVTNEVHDLSQVFTGGIYDVLADIFAFERRVDFEDEAATLLRVGRDLFRLVLRAIMAAPAFNASFADVVNKMLSVAAADGKPVEYRNFIRNRFTLRQVVVSPTPLTQNIADDAELEEVAHPHLTLLENGLQNRSACCGTLRLREYSEPERDFADELERLRNGIGGCEDEDAIAAE
jgi:hypothetical protein